MSRGSFALFLAMLGLTIGCHKDVPEPKAQPAARNASEAAPGKDPAGTPEGVLPILSRDALSARHAAQQRLLGASGLFEDLEGRALAPLKVDNAAPTGDAAGLDGLDALPGSAGIDGATPAAAGSAGIGPRPNGNTLGLYTPLEGAPGALDHFYKALREVHEHRGRRNPEAPRARIVVYGASHTQADWYTGYLRDYLQERFGPAGPGFVPAGQLNPWHKTLDYALEQSEGWVIEHAQRGDGDGRYGLLGASFRSRRKGAWTRVFPRPGGAGASEGMVLESTNASEVDQIELHYLEQPGGGQIKLLVDGEPLTTVDTSGTRFRSATYEASVQLGAHEFELVHDGGGPVRVYGYSLERRGAGVMVDALGIAGTRAANQLRWDLESWRPYFQAREADLWVLQFGTNESTDGSQPLAEYEQNLRRVIERYKEHAPQASCLLLGPGDSQRELGPEVWAQRPRVREIVEVQRRLAPEYGCAFWDAMAFMGGPNSIDQWVRARPQMASQDHVHLTPRGYVRMGMALADALMANYEG